MRIAVEDVVELGYWIAAFDADGHARLHCGGFGQVICIWEDPRC